MDDLISRKALREAMYHEAFEMDSDMQKWDSGCWIRYKMFENHLKDAPSVPAVPLDKLCEWLANSCYLPCVSCESLFGDQWCKQHPYRCHSKEHWKDAITKWLEEMNK